jgi:DNA-binding GntR family transcriptional regulator
MMDTTADLTGTVAPIARRTLHDEVAQRVRDMIIEGRLAPGQRLNEGALGRALGVSRTPLREAIKTLASEGLVEIVPARGAVVRTPTLKDIADSLAVLKALEQLAAREICAQAHDDALAELAGLHAAMLDRYRARDRLAYFKLNQAIHSAIARLSGNAVLAEVHTQLQSRMRRVRFIGHEGPEKWAAAVAEHEEMAAAFARRDGAAAARVIGRHLDNALARVRGSLWPSG